MKKLLFILFTIIAPLFISCGSDDDEAVVPEVEDNYYVKYEVQGTGNLSTHYAYLNIEVNTPEGKKQYVDKTRAPKFSQTYGPVKKGFVASVQASGSHVVTSQIYVSVNQEPFALKAEGEGEGELHYVIN